jgi:hypothetical protein
MMQIARPTLHEALTDAVLVLDLVKPNGKLAYARRVAGEALAGTFDLRDAARDVAASIEVIGASYDMRLAYVWRVCREASDASFSASAQ